MALGRQNAQRVRAEQTTIALPTYWVGSLQIRKEQEISQVPLSTLETALVPSINRGMKVLREAGGCDVTCKDHGWSRAPLFATGSVVEADQLVDIIHREKEEIKEIAEGTTRYGHAIDIQPIVIGTDVHMRLVMSTGDAAGHNMVTKAAHEVAKFLVRRAPYARCITVSGNMCTDKKNAAINPLLGHGCEVRAGVYVDVGLCDKILKVHPQDLVELVTKKDHVGSIAAGSVWSANAHVANILAAMYLATGQDIANIVEGAQAITTAEIRGSGLYFAVTMPTLVVGTLGNGKERGDQKKNLERLECYGAGTPSGAHKERLAKIIGATALAGELSLHAALASEYSSHLVKAHEDLERR